MTCKLTIWDSPNQEETIYIMDVDTITDNKITGWVAESTNSQVDIDYEKEPQSFNWYGNVRIEKLEPV